MEPSTPQGYTTQTVSQTNTTYHYAGFWIRLLAYIIDAVILGIISQIASYVFDLNEVLFQGIVFIIGIAYTIGFWLSRGATPGKMALSLKIVSVDGQDLSVGQCALRYIGYFVSGIVFALGYIWIGIDSKKQGWHDKIAKTYVVRT